jgi:hypothetical protein
MTMLEPMGRGMRSQVLLTIKASNSASIACRQLGLVSTLGTEEGTDDMVGVVVADKLSLLFPILGGVLGCLLRCLLEPPSPDPLRRYPPFSSFVFSIVNPGSTISCYVPRITVQVLSNARTWDGAGPQFCLMSTPLGP